MNLDQQLEWDILLEMYPAFISQHTIRIPVEHTLTIQSNEMRHEITHLPDIMLQLSFPKNYPVDACVEFKLEADWINTEDKERISNLFRSWWNDQRCGILVQMVEFLSHELTEFLGIGSDLLLGEKQSHLFDKMVHFNRQRAKQRFQQMRIRCGICLEHKSGLECFMLSSCQHKYCLTCLTDYFGYLIERGEVEAVVCPEKCAVVLNDLAEILEPDQVDRYTSLLKIHTLQKQPNVIHCPRPFCQYPNLKVERLVICTECTFAFCWMCGRSWHGVQACTLKNKNEIVKEYLEGGEETKQFLEMKYSKTLLDRLVYEYRVDMLNLEYLASNSTPCPRCKTNVERAYGCNHMTCTVCKAHFCYLCGCDLSSIDPYQHFQSGPCRNRLFEGTELNEENFENDILPHIDFD
jgi:E3 ubiquitin-protein ligase RNF14